MQVTVENLEQFFEYLDINYEYAFIDKKKKPQILEEMHNFIELYKGTTPENRSLIISRITLSMKWNLLAYARAMTEEALNYKDVEKLKEGLIALFIDNYSFDKRETIIVSYLFLDIARRLGISILDMLEEISYLAPARAMDGLKSCFMTNSESTMESFGYYLKESKNGYLSIRSKNDYKPEGEESMISLMTNPADIAKTKELFRIVRQNYEED